jgi:hypothetical protein
MRIWLATASPGEFVFPYCAREQSGRGKLRKYFEKSRRLWE